MAVGFARSARDIAFTLEVKSPKIFENIFLNHGVLFLFGAKGRVKLVRGGNRFDERVHLGQNTNVAHRDRYADIDTNMQDNWRTASYGRATADGLTRINFVDEDENQGNAQIGNETLAQSSLDDLMNTFPNTVADAIISTAASTPTGPINLLEELPATLAGAQAITTGGIVRSDFPGPNRTQMWQTQFSNTGADLGTAAGIATVSAFILNQCSEGAAVNLQPDIAITHSNVMSQAYGAADILRRYTVNDDALKFKFDHLQIQNTMLMAERNMPANNALFLNTNFMHVQVLVGRNVKHTGDVKVIGDGAVSVPLNIGKPIEAYNRLDYAIKAWITYNITFGALKYHGRMNNLTQATLVV